MPIEHGPTKQPPPPHIPPEEHKPGPPKPPHPPGPPLSRATPSETKGSREAHKKKSGKALFLGLILGTLIVLVVGAILYYLSISINVILPVLAPIWVGSVTLGYTVLRGK